MDQSEEPTTTVANDKHYVLSSSPKQTSVSDKETPFAITNTTKSAQFSSASPNKANIFTFSPLPIHLNQLQLTFLQNTSYVLYRQKDLSEPHQVLACLSVYMSICTPTPLKIPGAWLSCLKSTRRVLHLTSTPRQNSMSSDQCHSSSCGWSKLITIIKGFDILTIYIFFVELPH